MNPAPLTPELFFDREAMVARYAAAIAEFADCSRQIIQNESDPERIVEEIRSLGPGFGIQICAAQKAWQPQANRYSIAIDRPREPLSLFSLSPDNRGTYEHSRSRAADHFEQLSKEALSDVRRRQFARSTQVPEIAIEIARSEAAKEGRGFVAIDKMAIRILSSLAPSRFQTAVEERRLQLGTFVVDCLLQPSEETAAQIITNLSSVGPALMAGTVQISTSSVRFSYSKRSPFTLWNISHVGGLISATSNRAKDGPNCHWVRKHLSVPQHLPEAALFMAAHRPIQDVVDHPIFEGLDLNVVEARNLDGTKARLTTDAHRPSTLFCAEYALAS